ncbi:hypothetical protein R6Q59_030577 [Mikania micrantha]
MKKAFRDIKRGVNKKVLKVPSIEQKVLDATSNESWGPHGTHLADIAQASRNYHEHQIIMSVIWKRLNDTGKNWRHVFKALTVLEYLVANGSERVVEDVREHAYHISNLSSFQYIDSSGRDQGSNVRQKSQSLVALVNDKEKIQEAREKAAASRLRQTPGDDRYEGQYGDKDEDHNGYGRERDWNNRDSYGRDGYGDDEHQRKSHSVDGDYGAKSQSSDRDDGHHSSRVSNGRVEDGSPDGSRLETKLSGQNLEAPPSYEDAVTEGETPPPPPPAVNHQETVLSNNSAPPVAATPPLAVTTPPLAATTPSVFPDKETDGFDFFDPRAAPPAASSAASSAEVDLFGSLSDSFASDVLALVPSEPHAPTGPSPSQTFVAVSPATQQYDDPFGDGPFRAVPSTDAFSAQQSTSPFTELPLTVAQTTVNDIGFGDGFDDSVDILAGILPPTGPPTLPSQTIIQPQADQHSTETVFHSQPGQPKQTPFSLNFSGPFGPTMSQPSYPGPFDQPTPQPAFPVQGGYQSVPSPSFPAQGSQSVLPPDFSAAHNQSVLPHDFPAAHGGQSMMQPNFPETELPPGFPAQSSQSVLPPDFWSQGSQSMPPPSFLATQSELPSSFLAQSSQSVSSSGFPAAQGGQSETSSGFPTAQVGQSELPSVFPAQSGQSLSSSGFPTAQGGQSVSSSGFAATQGSQSKLPSGFPAQIGQSVPPPSFLATQSSQSVSSSGFPAAQSGQSVLSSGFPAAQGGHSGFPSGFPAQSGQSVSPSGLTVAQGGQSELSGFPAQSSQSVSPFGFPVAQGSQSVLPPGFPAAQGGQSVPPSGFPASQGGQSVLPPGYPAAQGGQSVPPSGFPASQGGQSVLPPGYPAAQGGQSDLPSGFPAQGTQSVLPPGFTGGQPVSQLGFTGSQNASLGGNQSGTISQAGFSPSNGQTGKPNNNPYGSLSPQGQPTPAPTPQAVSISSFYQQSQLQSNTSLAMQPPSVTASTGALAVVRQQPAEEKFETKSTVWADTLNRGLVNLNISGSKTNPLSDIGIDFEAINRKEKRMEKPSKTPVTSNVAMGKAMGSGSGIGRAGAGALKAAPNPMVGSGMGMGAPGAPGYWSMGMNSMAQNMGIGMNSGQGFQMQPTPATGYLQPGSYNPMMGRGGGGYGQQPYGGYR